MVDDSRWLYALLVAVVGAERLVELALTKRHARRLAARGGYQVGRGHYPVMVVLHGGLLAACLAEVLLLDRPFLSSLGWSMAVVVGLTMALRWWAISTLGERWTTTVWVLPGEPAVGGGPYRYLRHPNYLAVAVEVAALPLVHTAWWTALAFGAGNLFLLRHRIGVEEAALAATARG